MPTLPSGEGTGHLPALHGDVDRGPGIGDRQGPDAALRTLRPFHPISPISQTGFLQAPPATPEAERLAHCPGQRGPRPRGAGRSPGGGPGRRAEEGGPAPAPGRSAPHLHELVLVEAERVRPRGQAHPASLHRAGRRLSAPRSERGREAGGGAHGRGGGCCSHDQFPRSGRHRFRQHGSARCRSQSARTPAGPPPPAPPRGAGRTAGVAAPGGAAPCGGGRNCKPRALLGWALEGSSAPHLFPPRTGRGAIGLQWLSTVSSRDCSSVA